MRASGTVACGAGMMVQCGPDSPVDVKSFFGRGTWAVTKREKSSNFSGLEDWKVSHGSDHGDLLHTDKFRFKRWVAIFQEHFDDFFHVRLQFIERCGLRMGTWKPWDEANVVARLKAAFDHGGKLLHSISQCSGLSNMVWVTNDVQAGTVWHILEYMQE